MMVNALMEVFICHHGEGNHWCPLTVGVNESFIKYLNRWDGIFLVEMGRGFLGKGVRLRNEQAETVLAPYSLWGNAGKVFCLFKQRSPLRRSVLVATWHLVWRRQGQKAVTCGHVTTGAEVWDGRPDMWQGDGGEKGNWLGQETRNCMKSMGMWNLDPRPLQFTPLSYLYVLLQTSYLCEPQSLPL